MMSKWHEKCLITFLRFVIATQFYCFCLCFEVKLWLLCLVDIYLLKIKMQTHFDNKLSHPFQNHQVSVPIVSNDRCKSMFLRAGRHEFIPEIFLCAGHESGGMDSCQGN